MVACQPFGSRSIECSSRRSRCAAGSIMASAPSRSASFSAISASFGVNSAGSLGLPDRWSIEWTRAPLPNAANSQLGRRGWPTRCHNLDLRQGSATTMSWFDTRPSSLLRVTRRRSRAGLSGGGCHLNWARHLPVRSALEVADVFRRHGAAYRKAHAGHLSSGQRRVMGAIETCLPAALGKRASFRPGSRAWD